MNSLPYALNRAFVSFVLVLLAGSPALAADGKVSGKVTLNGKPVASGKIVFHLGNGQFVGANIKDGEYTVDRVPTGKQRVTIEGKGVPAKYSSEESSALQIEIKEGRNAFDIELKK